MTRTTPPSIARTAAIRALRANGMSYARIGLQFGLSAERVRQILKRPDAVIERRSKEAFPRGICPRCGREVPLRLDGTPWHHHTSGYPSRAPLCDFWKPAKTDAQP